MGKLVHLQIYFRKPTPNSVGPDSPFTIPPHPLHPRRTSSPLRTAARSENGTTPKSFPTVATARKLSEIFARIRSVSAGYRWGRKVVTRWLGKNKYGMFVMQVPQKGCGERKEELGGGVSVQPLPAPTARPHKQKKKRSRNGGLPLLLLEVYLKKICLNESSGEKKRKRKIRIPNTTRKSSTIGRQSMIESNVCCSSVARGCVLPGVGVGRKHTRHLLDSSDRCSLQIDIYGAAWLSFPDALSAQNVRQNIGNTFEPKVANVATQMCSSFLLPRNHMSVVAQANGYCDRSENRVLCIYFLFLASATHKDTHIHTYTHALTHT